jgi:enoyl-CoA hydratase
MGLVNRVVPKSELAAYVRNDAETIAANAPLTVQAVKRITAELTKPPAERDMALCEALVAGCYASEDHREGRLAFAEKRRPVFHGH